MNTSMALTSAVAVSRARGQAEPGDNLVPVGMYRRVSEDKALKRGHESAWREVEEQVKEQARAVRDLEAQMGNVQVVRDYCDNNTPASDPFVIREAFEALLSDMEAGIIHGVLFLHSDRLARLLYDAARINRLFEMNPHYVGRSVEGGVDLSTVEGRTMFAMQATMGTAEIGNTKRRVTRTNRVIAQKGVMHGGPRAFGWKEDRRTLHPEESELIRKALLAIPGGYRVADFRRDLVEYGYEPRKTKRSREGKRKIEHSAAEAMLISPRVAGLRFYVPETERRLQKKRLWLPDYIVRVDGESVKGDWEAIADPDEWQPAIDEIRRRKEAYRDELAMEHDTSAKYLCSGIARCGKCMSPMWSNPYAKGTGAYEKWGFRYQCQSNHGGCGGVSRVGPPVDDLVETAFLLETRRGLGQDVARKEEVDESVHDARLKEIAEEIADATARRKAGRLSMSASLDAIEELEEERSLLTAQRGKLALRKRRQKLLTVDALADWENLTMPEKRTRLKESIRAVVVHPAGRGKRFDPDLIEIVWAE
ncbi:recombinase family protein [Streptomyces sp. NPDC094438]|uniref:recombinase family protein n=1 Tax=Streptomyces sp. NPDC094438 TaxID=3366061 RepID=UPI0037F3D5A2